MPFSRRQLLKATALASLPGALGSSLAQKRRQSGPKFNVLLIAVDDLRPDLGCYGNRYVRTPNIDRLAGSGLTFTRAYCQQSAGNASRTSLMTGRRPDSTRVFDDETHFRRFSSDITTLPQQFRKFNYTTTAFGKIFQSPALDDFPSWSVPSWSAGRKPWHSAENAAIAEQQWQQLEQSQWIVPPSSSFETATSERAASSWDSPDVADHALPDGQAADAAVAALRELRGKPFFLAAGFLRPHLPFIAPKKYFDLYPLDNVPLAKNQEPPSNMPDFALPSTSELRRYSDIGSQPLSDAKARELVRAYYACVSYVDAQIGRLLDTLDELGLREETVVVLWADNGYHLGDHGLWTEQTNFEVATRAPLIVCFPGQRNAGRKSPALTESVDLYPSVCEICEVPRPLGLEGSSFVPLFEDPERLWKRAVFSQVPREIPGIGPGTGYSMRTSRYRYTEWTAGDSPFHSAELYDYQSDPLEQRNIANLPQNISLVNGLQGMLREGWRASLPPTDLRSTDKNRS